MADLGWGVYAPIYADVRAVQITGDMTIATADRLGLVWDEYGDVCGQRGPCLDRTPAPIGAWLVQVADGTTVVLSDAAFRALFQ